MSYIKNDRLLKTIAKKAVDCTPIWLMRQAGRYLPEYRAVRERAKSFMNLCKTPELACEVTLQPIMRYPLDAAIIFSDILTIPDAMGLDLSFVEGKGPLFAHPVRDEKSIHHLSLPDLAHLEYVYEAIRLVKHELAQKIPLIGFCGSPFTLAAYMIEGQSTPGFPLIKEMIHHAKSTLHQLLMLLADAVTAHLNAQIEAGVDVVMLFDTWGGMLNTSEYMEFSLQYIQKIISGLIRKRQQQAIPVIVFTKGGTAWLTQIANCGCDVISMDWHMNLGEARKLVGDGVSLQGNMDPLLLLSSPDVIQREVAKILQSFGQGPGHVFNLGHGITPDVPPEHVLVLVDAVHEMSKVYHQAEK